MVSFIHAINKIRQFLFFKLSRILFAVFLYKQHTAPSSNWAIPFPSPSASPNVNGISRVARSLFSFPHVENSETTEVPHLEFRIAQHFISLREHELLVRIHNRESVLLANHLRNFAIVVVKNDKIQSIPFCSIMRPFYRFNLAKLSKGSNSPPFVSLRRSLYMFLQLAQMQWKFWRTFFTGRLLGKK